MGPLSDKLQPDETNKNRKFFENFERIISKILRKLETKQSKTANQKKIQRKMSEPLKIFQ